MPLRMLLALLMILSAPLAAVQHLGCAQSAAAVTADSHAHHAMPGAGPHDHHAVIAAAHMAADNTAQDCDSCDASCLAACAAAAMPASPSDLPVISSHAAPDLPCVRALLLSHPLPLLRPPTLRHV